MNSTVSIRKIEFLVKNLTTEKFLGPDGYLGEFYHVKKRINTHFTLALLEKIREGNITLFTKMTQVSIGKENEILAN